MPAWYKSVQNSANLNRIGPDGTRYRISVIVATRNEEANLRPVLDWAAPYSDELTVVDGHSKDATREIAVECGAKVILDNNRGKGDAIRIGIKQATGDILVFIDADGSHDPRDIPALVKPIVDGIADHVSGSRMLGGSDELHATVSQFVRLLGNQIITLGINYTLNVRLTDCENGFRAILRDVALALNLQEDIATIEQEMTIKTIRSGYRLIEIPAHEYERANGQSNIQLRKTWFQFVRSWLYYLFLWRPSRRR